MHPRRDANAHRCSHCDVNWPWTRAYAELCPLCEQPTWIAPEIPLTLDEARQLQNDLETSRRNREAFEAYYNSEHRVLICAMCGGPNTVVDTNYSICIVCDRPDPDLNLSSMGGWDDALLPED